MSYYTEANNMQEIGSYLYWHIYKVYGYACFYKADVTQVDSIQVNEITLSFVCKGYPRKLIEHLTEVRGFTIEQYETGIYYIKGDIFPIQLIVTSRLSKEHNFWLKNLTDDLTDTEAVRELAREYQDKQRNILYRSVMNVIIKANEKLFKEECGVCEAIIDLFRDEYDEGIAKAKADGIQQGMQHGMREKILSLFRKGLLNLENAAEELNVTVEEFEKMVKEEA